MDLTSGGWHRALRQIAVTSRRVTFKSFYIFFFNFEKKKILKSWWIHTVENVENVENIKVNFKHYKSGIKHK